MHGSQVPPATLRQHLVLALLGHAHTVEGGLEAVIAPVLQGVPNVDGDGALHRVTWVPQP